MAFRKDRLKLARKSKKLTMEQLAKLVNTTKGTISNYENGHSTPPNDMLSLLAEKLNVTTDYLLGMTDDPTPYQQQKVLVAGKEIELTPDEFKVFEEIRKHSILFHDLASDPERKVKQLIRMWETIKTVIEEENEERDDTIGD